MYALIRSFCSALTCSASFGTAPALATSERIHARTAASRVGLNTLTATSILLAPNGWRVSGERRAEGDERVRCTRVLGRPPVTTSMTAATARCYPNQVGCDE